MVLAFQLVSFTLFISFMLWAPAAAVIFCARRMGLTEPDRAIFYWRALKWPALAGILMMWGSSYLAYPSLNSPDVWCFGIFLAYWITFRNTGKKKPPTKPKQVRARIKQVGGRLVLVSEVTTG